MVDDANWGYEGTKKDVEEASKKANLLGLKVGFHLSTQWY